MKRLLQRLRVWLLKDAGSHAQRCQAVPVATKTSGLEAVMVGVVLFIVAVCFTMVIAMLTGASAPKPKLSVADKMAMAKSYSVPCLDCNSSGVLKYRLKPIKPPMITGGRAVPNGVMQEIILHFRCPVRHEFSAPGPDRFIPAIRAEEEK